MLVLPTFIRQLFVFLESLMLALVEIVPFLTWMFPLMLMIVLFFIHKCQMKNLHQNTPYTLTKV